MFLVEEVVVSAVHAAGEVQARPNSSALAGDKPHTGDLTLAGVHVYVPSSYREDRPAGVLVMLHGAGGDADQALRLVKRVAAGANIIVVAPKSEHATWDVIHDRLGPDVARIDKVLSTVFARYAVDAARVAIGGFSDGASYALTLGLVNGDLFRTILAFSPGYEASPRRRGKPRIFVSHGIDDGVLPIERTSRVLVPALKRAGLAVEYFEFDGRHTVPGEALRKAFALLGT
jgi:phospholipase/carboxylesterase